MNWEAEALARDRELAARPGARQPASFGEIVASAWAAAGLRTLTGSVSSRFTAEAYEELVTGLATAAGRSADDIRRMSGDAITPEARAEALQPVFAGLVLSGRIREAEERDRLEGLFDIAGRAEEKAGEVERQAAETSAATYGFGGHALAWLTGIARETVEPVNLGAGIAAGPLSGRLFPMLFRQAAVSGGAQALQEPFIQSGRAELGLSHGFGEALFSIGGAAVGGAGLAGLFRGAAAALRALRPGVSASLPEPGVTVLPEIAIPAARASPDDFEAAARLAERNRAIAAVAPGRPAASPAMAAVHAERIDAAQAALERSRPLPPEPRPAAAGPVPEETPFRPQKIALRADDAPEQLIRPRGERVEVRYAVVELGDVVVSHNADGSVNPAYPAELQPRDRSSAASRSFIAERAGELEPELLGRSPTPTEGAPVVGPGGVVESGNGRVLMIARAYDQHPERADAYRAFLRAQGYDLEGFRFPVLIRIRESSVGDRAAFAREANVARTAGLSPRERAAVDARLLDNDILSMWRGGGVNDLRNVPFVRAFARRAVPAEEIPSFISADNRLSADGARRIEAALVARAYQAPDLVTALFEDPDPTSRAIIGALADVAPVAARLRAALDDGRVAGNADVIEPLMAALRLVDRARATRQKVSLLRDQVDLERGAVPEPVREAVRLFFRDDDLLLAAGRERVAERLEKAIGDALDTQSGPDMFGYLPGAVELLRGAQKAGDLLDDIDIAPAAATAAGGVRRQGNLPDDVWAARWRALKDGQPFATVDELYAAAPAHQAELMAMVAGAAEGKPGIRLHDPGFKGRAATEEKIARKRYRSPRRLTDVVRAGAEVDTPADADALVARLGEFGTVVDEGWTVNEAGYFDRKAMIVLADGQIAELQLWPPAIYAAKDRGSAMYTLRRSEPDPDKAAAMLAEEQAYWAPILEGLPAAWSAIRGLSGPGPNASRSPPNILRAVSSDIGRPSQPTSAAFTDTQPSSGLSTQAESVASSTTASLVSQSNSLIGRSSDPNVSAAGTAGKIIGDPELAADADRVLAELGDLEIVTVDPIGNEVRQSARAALGEVEEDAAAARELLQCIAGTTAETGT